MKSHSTEEKHTLTSATPSLLRVENICKRYGNQPVLQQVSFSMEAGECVALMGPSGSGKSTLLNLLSGIDRPDSGNIYIHRTDLFSAPPKTLNALRQTEISTIFQFFHLLPTLTAYENIELTLQIAGVSTQDRKPRVEELLDAVELTSHANAYPDTLSGGEAQRIAIARALAHRPKLILADEPTGSLDSKTGRKTLDLLKNLTKTDKIALFLVTHSAEAAAVCDRTLHLHDGCLT
jgi:ABC-type lipoprotein export system ATPase subunit